MTNQPHSATYSPDDNKLRLYPAYRLDAEDYAAVKAAGFKWAPQQELFVAGKWTPAREDLLIRMCGEIDDDDSTLTERADERAERFEGYSDKRAKDAERAQAGVAAIADGIPLGQPILVGHHSERHARKDAERIENGMRRAVKMWETSDYWKSRAAGALAHAKYKELPTVRARRIKTIQTDKRRDEKTQKKMDALLMLWRNMDDASKFKRADGNEPTLLQRAMYISNFEHSSRCYPLDKYPRQPPASQYEGAMGLWSALDGGVITPEQAQDIAIRSHEGGTPYRARWLAHYENRLAYETAMLDDQGGADLLKPKARAKQLPLCNYRAPDGIDLPNLYNRGTIDHYPQAEMTKAEYARIHSDYKSGHVVERSHRVRCAIVKGVRSCVFLTDSKVHERPEPIEPTPIEPPAIPVREYVEQPEYAADRPEVKALKEAVKAGVQVITAPQLFPTPKDLAQRAVDLAGIEPGHRVLEPSAGTGNILKAIGPAPDKVAVEINDALATGLTRQGHSGLSIINADFLECGDEIGTFDRIVMNPPFKNGADIKHIEHARAMLKPGGVLVAICANGPRQNDKLRPIASEWFDLPAGSFLEAGTGVNAALVMIEA